MIEKDKLIIEFENILNVDTYSQNYFDKIIRTSEFQFPDYKNDIKNKIVAFHFSHFVNHSSLKLIFEELLKFFDKKEIYEFFKQNNEIETLYLFLSFETKIALLNSIHNYEFIKLLLLLTLFEEKVIDTIKNIFINKQDKSVFLTNSKEKQDLFLFLEEVLSLEKSINKKIFYFSSLNKTKQNKIIDYYKNKKTLERS